MKVYISKSKIEGEGLMSNQNFDPGSVVTEVTRPYPKNCRDPFPYLNLAGKKTNHSYSPNAVLKKIDNGDSYHYVIVTSQHVEADEELTVNYNTLQPDFGPAKLNYI